MPGNPHIWKTRPLFAGVAKIEERIVCNLCPVVEIPKFVYSAESRFREESEIAEICEGPGPIPFLLKGARLYSLAPLERNSVLAAALRPERALSQGFFAEWLSDERSDWAIELLNRSLRRHAWKRGMRFDDLHRLFYFTRTKPKKLWWEMSGKLIQREVTAAHMKWNRLESGEAAEYQRGWKHEAVRAAFASVDGSLFLQMEPGWILTELDGKTPSTAQSVGPVRADETLQEANERVLQALRFWSGVFAKGHRELRIDTGANPIRVRLTPAGGSSESLAPAFPVVDEAQLIPELVPIES